jgi:serine/threonine protein kinase
MADLEGVMLSDYLIMQCISKGGVADVYRARPVSENVEPSDRKSSEVAVKVFRPGYAQRESFRDYFIAEAEKIGRFIHPNILPFLEYGEGDDLLYLVTPFMLNGTLDDLLRRVGGHFSAIQALPIMEQLCSAVQYAHDADVLHGNIKPSNVFVASDGRILLSDFGIAHGYDDSQQSLTRVGWGSAEYAAPEQSLGVLRRPSDVYALGVLLFHILTGSTPFTGQTPVEVLLKHVRQEPPSARTFVTTISDAVDDVLQKAMRKRSDDRFASAQELLHAFVHAVKIAPVASPASRPIPTVKLKPFYATAKTNPLTPPPVLLPKPLESPQTPVPAEDTLDTPLPAALPRTREVFSSPIPHLFGEHSPSSDSPLSMVEEPEGAETFTKHFLTERDERGESLFWSVDPSEWSPIAKETEENAEPDVPFTANDYLQSKPLVLTMPDEVALEQKMETFQARLKKLLPILVVLLLLLGLLGAMLSAFFYPTSKPGVYSGTFPTRNCVLVDSQKYFYR